MKRNEMINVLNFYYERSIIIHIDTSDGKFYNGIIKSVRDNLLILEDRKLGDVAIHLDTISNLERYKNKENENDT